MLVADDTNVLERYADVRSINSSTEHQVYTVTDKSTGEQLIVKKIQRDDSIKDRIANEVKTS